MNVVITGSSNGIGAAVTRKFLNQGHTVWGIDTCPYHPIFSSNGTYTHCVCDVRKVYHLPDISNIDILINNAGVQDSDDDIGVNLKGVINTTKKYGLQPNIKSICNLASVSAHNGAEFPEYVASKGGVLSYTIWTAKEIAKYGATCNSLSFGGVITSLNDTVLSDENKWNHIKSMTPLKKWATVDECAEWVYFFTVINKSCTGQDLIIDNGEMINHEFVW